MMQNKSAYAQAGVDYSLLEPFKRAMVEVGRRTLSFPNRRAVFIREDLNRAHGAVFEYRGGRPHLWCQTEEGLGNKNWIAEWMYLHAGRNKTYYDAIAIDTALMAVNDVIAQGAMPAVFTDHIQANDSQWYADQTRAADLANGFMAVCEEVGMALPAGESATNPYLINPRSPVAAAPALSGSVIGLVAPASRLVTGGKLAVGDRIIGAASSGLHSNGVSLVIQKAMQLPDQLLTKLPDGKTLGETALIPTRSYVRLIEALLAAETEIHALLPGTGGGVSKIAFDSRPFSYRIQNWPEVPLFFRFFRESGLALQDCLQTFNWGIGYYIFAPPAATEEILKIGRTNGYELYELGVVEAGLRQVIFEPEQVVLTPPGE